MKKLMIAAVVAAMGAGAFAECQEDTPGKCVFAYKLTMSGKTGIAYSTKGNASKCIEDACYLKPGSFKLTGYVYGQTEEEGSPDTCNEGCGCNDFSTIESVVYNKKAGVAAKDMIAVTQIDLIGSDAKKAQVALTYNTDIVLAGFGTAKDKTLKSASGNFAGLVAAPECETCTYDKTECEDKCESTAATVFALCTLDKADAEKTVAYGKWSLKADKSAVKKLTKNYDPTVLLPKGVKLAE